MTKFEQNMKEKIQVCDIIKGIYDNNSYGYEYAKERVSSDTDNDGYYACQVSAYEKIFAALEKLL